MIELKAVDFITSKGIKKGVEEIYPVKFQSQHVPKTLRGTSWVILIAGTLFLLGQSFFKGLFQKCKPKEFEKEYDVLFYVPNYKYENFRKALTTNSNYTSLIISEEGYKSGIISVGFQDNAIGILYSFQLIFELKKVFWYCFKNRQLKDFQNYYWQIISLIRRDLVANCLFRSVSFKKFFSFHPVGDFHQVIQSFYRSQFEETYAIRPTTTSINTEHKFINTDNLFYKTDEEKKIYEASNLNTKIIKGGLIAQPRNISNTEKIRTSLLFLDTCTNTNQSSAGTRRKAIKDFLNYTKELDIDIYFKFHPGLIASEKRETEKQIQESGNIKLYILDVEIPWESINLALGFDTTLFYECFLYKIPVLSFRENYSLFPNVKTEFEESPILPIGSAEDFEAIQKLTIVNYQKVIIQQQTQWFERQYNFPDGMNSISKLLQN